MSKSPTGVYVYCLLPGGAPPPPGVRGLDDAAVEALDDGSLCAWISRRPARPTATLPRVRAHHAVAEAAAATGHTPLPFRFGQWLDDVSVLHDRLAAKRAAWSDRLAEFTGACELGVRVDDPAAAAARDVRAGAGGGRAYLEQIAREHARQAERSASARLVAASLRAAVDGLVRRERVEFGRTALFTAAHLVAVTDIVPYRAAVAATRDAYPHLAFLDTGPWPPYSFAE